MRDLIDCQLDRFGISPRQGFLGNGTPLHRLTNSYYDPWESLIEDLPALVSNCQIRSQIRQLPVLDARHLKQEKEWQRAYVVLGFLTHAYIWGGETPSEVGLLSALFLLWLTICDSDCHLKFLVRSLLWLSTSDFLSPQPILPWYRGTTGSNQASTI